MLHQSLRIGHARTIISGLDSRPAGVVHLSRVQLRLRYAIYTLDRAGTWSLHLCYLFLKKREETYGHVLR